MISALVPGSYVPAAASRELASPADAYAVHFGLVFRNLRRLGVDEPVVEDAVQDVFVVVFRRWREFEQRSSLRTWIFGIVVRVARDYRRARKRHVARLRLAQQDADTRPHADSPHVDAELREATRVLHTVLDSLEEEQRTLIVLADLEELPSAEVAEIMKLNPSTCRGKIAAARRAFADAVERLAPDMRLERSVR